VNVQVIKQDQLPLSKHPYEEIFITLEGEATFSAKHAFTNSGDGRLRQIDIHVSSTFSTEWV
jgi:hypothetical protein